MSQEYSIVEIFEITGRGAVVVIDEMTENIQGKPYEVVITDINGKSVSTQAFKEWLLIQQPQAIEKEAYRLKGLHKQDILEATKIKFS